MIEVKLKEIHDFCVKNSSPEIVKKYSRYFKEGFDGFGIDHKTFEKQRDLWIVNWKDEMSLDQYLELGDQLMQRGRFEEKSLAIQFIQSERDHYTVSTFDRIAQWFDMGISNWATTDVLCMLVLAGFVEDEVISYVKLKDWTTSDNQWKRRAVPVTLVEMINKGLSTETAFFVIEPLMLDQSEYVQKGIGTLLRGLWKKYPAEVEEFLLIWKDRCGRLIVQYATEKMDKDNKRRFRKSK